MTALSTNINSLPQLGGIGSMVYVLIGSLIIILAVLMHINHKNKND